MSAPSNVGLQSGHELIVEYLDEGQRHGVLITLDDELVESLASLDQTQELSMPEIVQYALRAYVLSVNNHQLIQAKELFPFM